MYINVLTPSRFVRCLCRYYFRSYFSKSIILSFWRYKLIIHEVNTILHPLIKINSVDIKSNSRMMSSFRNFSGHDDVKITDCSRFHRFILNRHVNCRAASVQNRFPPRPFLRRVTKKSKTTRTFSFFAFAKGYRPTRIWSVRSFFTERFILIVRVYLIWFFSFVFRPLLRPAGRHVKIWTRISHTQRLGGRNHWQKKHNNTCTEIFIVLDSDPSQLLELWTRGA